MTKLDPEIIEAAAPWNEWGASPEERARRVINALAEHMPEEAVKGALDEFWNVLTRGPDEAAMRGAIATFLKHCGETK